jgi:hypothetical protein
MAAGPSAKCGSDMSTPVYIVVQCGKDLQLYRAFVDVDADPCTPDSTIALLLAAPLNMILR